VIAELATVIIGFLVTLPVELRRRRGLKIGASMVLVYLGLLTLQVPVSLKLAERKESLFAFLAYLGPAILLAAVWTWDICFILSRVFMLLIDSPGPGTVELDGLGAAYSALRRNDFRHALRLIKPEFLQKPLHYEALLLKAELHQRLNQKWRAKRTLTKILRLSNLSACQREYAANLLRALDDKAKACGKCGHPSRKPPALS